MNLTTEDYNNIGLMIKDRLRNTDGSLEFNDVEYFKGSESMVISYAISAYYTICYQYYESPAEEELRDFSFDVEDVNVYDYKTDEYTPHNLDEEKLRKIIYKQLKT